jgi:polyphosphate glucokinase
MEDAMNVLGIDIGGSGIKGAVVDVETGEMITPRQRVPTPEGAEPEDVARAVNELVTSFGWSGIIGCGFPSVVISGTAYSAANIHQDWIGTDVAGLLSVNTGCGVYVLNDADAAGLAEVKFGAGKEFTSGVIIMITIGTGVGSAIFVDGKLVPNTEFGHLTIRGKDAERRSSDFARQQKGQSWEAWAKKLNEHLSELEKLLWPDVFILGGGVSKSFDQFSQYLDLRARVIPAQLLNQAGIIGAAYYAYLLSSKTSN